MYKYQLEKYRGRSTRYVCPQCGRKQSFTRYIDTDTNQYISDMVGKCNRIDKCGYHYTPRQYFDDRPWLREQNRCSFVHNHRVFERTNKTPPPPCTLSAHLVEGSMRRDCTHLQWLRNIYGGDAVERVRLLYRIGGTRDGRAVFWQIDSEERVRTGKIMAYDAATGHRIKGEGSFDWVHSLLRRQGTLDEAWELRQCLYGEHLLNTSDYRNSVVAVVEAYKTAHVGAIIAPQMVWVAVDSLTGLTEERLAPLAGRDIILYPDEGRGYTEWSSRIGDIADKVGIRSWRVSQLMQGCSGVDEGADIVDALLGERFCPF